MLNQEYVCNALCSACINNEYMELPAVTEPRNELCTAIAAIDPTANDVGGINDELVNLYGAVCEKAGFMWGLRVAIALLCGTSEG